QVTSHSSTDQATVLDKIRHAMREVHGSMPSSLRSQHPRGLAVLQAGFEVLEAPPDLRHGLFAQAGKFPATVRLSNGIKLEDNLPDVRGLALKVRVGQAGEQDFLLASSPVFFARDAADFLRFLALKREHALQKLRAVIDFSDPVSARTVANPAKVVKELEGKQALEMVASGAFPILAEFGAASTDFPLTLTYHSQTPYRIGSQLVKYILEADPGNVAVAPLSNQPPQFAEALAAYFAAGRSARFTLGVIVQSDPARMPLEDATVRWEGPVIPLGRLEIGPQAVSANSTREEEAKLEFSPWHTLPGMEPVGSLNEARKAAYEDSAMTRHAHAQLIRRYFGCLACGDYVGMQACLDPKVEFRDLGFDLRGKEAVGLMWRMICTRQTGIRVSVRDIRWEQGEWLARWECQYDFAADANATPRAVHNKIDAHFQFDKESGLIVQHHDKAEFWPWFEQAMGPKGKALHLVDMLEDATRAVVDVEEKAHRKVREAALAKMRQALGIDQT
ncbi:MAG: nuclear transport factor 2 family protein, partial [Planctomycetaceae bacterium]